MSRVPQPTAELGDLGDPTAAGDTLTDPLFYRQVEGVSVDALNMATHGIAANGVTRVLDTFTAPVGMAYKLREATHYSLDPNPPEVEALARHLGSLPVVAESEPITAEVTDVSPHQGRDVAVYLDYPEFFEEQRALAEAVAEALQITGRIIGPRKPFVTVMEGQLPRKNQKARLEQIRAAVPPILTLSGVKSSVPEA